MPGKVRRVAVFGSRARGHAHEDSDVDVLVLLDEPSFLERREALDLAGLMGLEHDLVFSPIVLSVREWHELGQRERALPREVFGALRSIVPPISGYGSTRWCR